MVVAILSRTCVPGCRRADSTISESALPTAPPDCQQGVNLDRNFPTFWAMQEHSRGACSVEYRGPLPASEPETQALVNLVEQESFRGALIFHSLRGVQYQSQIMYPWFFLQAPSPLTDNERRHYERLAHNMQEAADDEIEFLVGPGARSQFDGDGTLTDYLWGRGIYTLLVTVGISGTSMAADSQYWPKAARHGRGGGQFFHTNSSVDHRQRIRGGAQRAGRTGTLALDQHLLA
jgi:hypothetical protein